MDFSASTERRVLLLAEWKTKVQVQKPKTLIATFAICDSLRRNWSAVKQHSVGYEATEIAEIGGLKNIGRPKKLPEARAREHLAKVFRFWVEVGLTEDQMIKEVSDMFEKGEVL